MSPVWGTSSDTTLPLSAVPLAPGTLIEDPADVGHLLPGSTLGRCMRLFRIATGIAT